MLKVSLLFTILRGIPEIYLLFVMIYVLSKKKIDNKKIILSACIIGILTYFIRLLPINFGIHTVMVFIIIIITNVYINKINIINVMSGLLVASIILFLSESINIWTIQKFFNITHTRGSIKTLKEFILSFPPLFIFLINIIIIKKIINRGNNNSD